MTDGDGSSCMNEQVEYTLEIIGDASKVNYIQDAGNSHFNTTAFVERYFVNIRITARLC